MSNERRRIRATTPHHMRSSEIASNIVKLRSTGSRVSAHDGSRHRRCRAAPLRMRARSRPDRRKNRRAGGDLGRGGRRPARVRRPSIRAVAASALVAALVGAWVVVLPTPTTPHRRRCRSRDVPVTTGAPIPGGRVEYSQPGNVTEAYRAVAGPDDGVAARGDAASARRRPRRTRLVAAPRALGRSRSLLVPPRRRARGNVVDGDRYGRARARSARGRRSRCTFHLVAQPARRRERRGSLTRTGSRW